MCRFIDDDMNANLTPAQRLAIGRHLMDRYVTGNEAELPNLRLRAHAHFILARRPELAPVLPALMRHPAGEQLLREIQ